MSRAPIAYEQQLADLAELVATGPLDLGAYTQAELAIVLGEVPALAGMEDVVLAEGVRSLAARGLLFREPGSDHIDIVGDIGLVVALVARRTGTLEIRRGHAGAEGQPWRWAISLLPERIAGVDRIDALGLHRLSLVSFDGLADLVVDRLLDGRAKIPREAAKPVPITDEQVRELTATSRTRWQLVHRVPRPDGTQLVVDALLLRLDEERVDLISRVSEGEGYQRVAIDGPALRAFLISLASLR